MVTSFRQLRGMLRTAFLPLLRIAHRTVFVRCFRFWELLGFHLTPVHYYQPIPRVRELRPKHWSRDLPLHGIDMRIDAQLELLEQFSTQYRSEYDVLPTNKTENPRQYHLHNSSFEYGDAEVLYCMIRHFKPNRMTEVGSGFSTLLAAQALLRNKEETGRGADYVAIDPYPNAVIRSGLPGLSAVLPEKVEDIDLGRFRQLGENDILFVDSTHVLTIGSDVQYLFLEVMPSLNNGVIVHLHDIFLPREYPRDWVLQEYRFWNEGYLLAAFLAFNSAFEVIWAGNFMHDRYPAVLRKAFISLDNAPAGWVGPGSFWIRRRL
jgi:hypothetical protein